MSLRSSILMAAWLCACTSGGVGQPNYILPFPEGQSHAVVQSFNGQYGHNGANAYAYDFSADAGSPVSAARAGIVVHVVESNPDAPLRQPQPGHENLIVIDHGDGTFGRYYHLTLNGADVQAGQRVAVGQLIGRSGNSGASFMPHLHFDVATGCYEYGCQTARFAFQGAEDDPLVEERMYAR